MCRQYGQRTVFIKRAFIAFFIYLAIGVSIDYCQAQPAFYLDKSLSTPDLTQTDPRANFTEGGKRFCAPVAVSDSLIWLSQHGFPRLLPKAENLTVAQIDMAKILASPGYMDTRAKEGTEVNSVLTGIKRYIVEHGYSIKRLEYQGLRAIDPEFNSGQSYPNPRFLKHGIIGKTGVWLNIGWYKYKAENETYRRIGGHWLTLVGYGADAQNKPQANVFIVHNPSSLAGLAFHNDFLHLILINNGVLFSHKGVYGFPRPAAGLYKITGDLPFSGECNAAILEGIIVLELH